MTEIKRYAPISFLFSQNSNLSDYDLNSPDILCSPTNFSDIYFGGARNLSLLSDLGGGSIAADPECSDHSNDESMQVIHTEHSLLMVDSLCHRDRFKMV